MKNLLIVSLLMLFILPVNVLAGPTDKEPTRDRRAVKVNIFGMDEYVANKVSEEVALVERLYKERKIKKKEFLSSEDSAFVKVEDRIEDLVNLGKRKKTDFSNDREFLKFANRIALLVGNNTNLEVIEKEINAPSLTSLINKDGKRNDNSVAIRNLLILAIGAFETRNEEQHKHLTRVIHQAVNVGTAKACKKAFKPGNAVDAELA